MTTPAVQTLARVRSRPLTVRHPMLGALGLSLLLSACGVFEAPTYQAESDSGTKLEPTTAGDAGGGDQGNADDDAGAGTADAGVAADGGSDAGEEIMEPSCVLPNIDVMDVCDGPIVINEVDGSGDDFIELYNRGTTAVNISGYVLADDSAGNPDVGDGVIVPPGTVLEPGRFLYVWANLPPPPDPDAPTELREDCIAGAPPPCLHTDWGVSASGERVYLLTAALEIACAITYPNAVFGGESFGRVPDGATSVCPLDPTPGEANAASSLR